MVLDTPSSPGHLICTHPITSNFLYPAPDITQLYIRGVIADAIEGFGYARRYCVSYQDSLE